MEGCVDEWGMGWGEGWLETNGYDIDTVSNRTVPQHTSIETCQRDEVEALLQTDAGGTRTIAICQFTQRTPFLALNASVCARVWLVCMKVWCLRV